MCVCELNMLLLLLYLVRLFEHRAPLELLGAYALLHLPGAWRRGKGGCKGEGNGKGGGSVSQACTRQSGGRNME